MQLKQTRAHHDTPRQNVTKIQNRYIEEQKLKKERTTSVQKKLRRRMLVILAIGLLVLIPMAKGVVENVFTIRSMEEKIASAKETEKNLKEENQDLKIQVGLLQDEDYIAKLARSRYYLSKEGEIIFSLPEDNRSKAAEQEETQQQEEE